MKVRNQLILEFLCLLGLCALIVWVAATSSCALRPEVTTEIPTFETPAEVWEWVLRTIRYEADPGTEYWKTPEQTLADGYGDCDDRALLTLWICYQRFGVKGELGIYFDHGVDRFHAAPWIDSKPIGNVEKTRVLVFLWPYDAAMSMAGHLRFNEEEL